MIWDEIEKKINKKNKKINSNQKIKD